MAKIKGLDSVLRKLNNVNTDIDNAIKEVLTKYANLILTKAKSGLPDTAASIRDSGNVEISPDGKTALIYFDSVIAAYIEFGTGDYAAEYLAGQPQEVVDEALKFFVSGEGTMPERPYFFNAFYEYRDAMIEELKKRVDIIANRFNVKS